MWVATTRLQRRRKFGAFGVVVIKSFVILVHADVGEDSRVISLESEERTGGDFQVGRGGGGGGTVGHAQESIGRSLGMTFGWGMHR